MQTKRQNIQSAMVIESCSAHIQPLVTSVEAVGEGRSERQSLFPAKQKLIN